MAFGAASSAYARMLALLIAAGAAVAWSCGPSFQVLYEGDARFEHCYAVDENPNVALQDKGECWHDWTVRYTYGQTRDRVEYALGRYRALSRVPHIPTDEAIMEAAPGAEQLTTARNVTAPAPTSAFEPPPKTLDEDGGGATKIDVPPSSVVPFSALPSNGTSWFSPSPASPVSSPKAPKSDCVDTCQRDWQHCGAACKEATETGCVACDAPYRKCMQSCFQSDPKKKDKPAKKSKLAEQKR